MLQSTQLSTQEMKHSILKQNQNKHAQTFESEEWNWSLQKASKQSTNKQAFLTAKLTN